MFLVKIAPVTCNAVQDTISIQTCTLVRMMPHFGGKVTETASKTARIEA